MFWYRFFSVFELKEKSKRPKRHTIWPAKSEHTKSLENLPVVWFFILLNSSISLLRLDENKEDDSEPQEKTKRRKLTQCLFYSRWLWPVNKWKSFSNCYATVNPLRLYHCRLTKYCARRRKNYVQWKNYITKWYRLIPRKRLNLPIKKDASIETSLVKDIKFL